MKIHETLVLLLVSLTSSFAPFHQGACYSEVWKSGSDWSLECIQNTCSSACQEIIEPDSSAYMYCACGNGAEMGCCNIVMEGNFEGGVYVGTGYNHKGDCKSRFTSCTSGKCGVESAVVPGGGSTVFFTECL